MSKAPIIITANLVNIEGVGLLIAGPAGSGKTETCLALAEQGFQFIADDSVELKRNGDQVIGRTISTTPRAHVRGIGLIDYSALQSEAPLRHTTVHAIVQLNPEGNSEEAIHEATQESLLGITLPCFTLNQCKQRDLALLLKLIAKQSF